MPFSSRRRWSAVQLGETTYVLGAPELFPLGGLQAVADEEARSGRRVVAFGIARGSVDEDAPPAVAQLLGLVVLGERLRSDARETVAFLRAQGVRIAVLSGDRPETVAAVAADAGIDIGEPVDGSNLPPDAASLRRLVDEHAVIGRIAPEGKKRVVEALTADGRYVAMIGDGVNDVPALKAARLAIAQGTGSQMARAVADLVLVRGDFASVPPLVAEGRKVLRNLQRVAKLFVAKSAFATFLVLSIGLTPQAYPLLPRHLSLAAGLTIGIPAFFLALGPSEGRFRSDRFLFDVGALRRACRHGRRPRRARELRLRAQRRAAAAQRVAHDRDERDRARRPLSRPRTRGDEPAAHDRRRRRSPGRCSFSTRSCSSRRSRGTSSRSTCRASAASSSSSWAPRSRSSGSGSPTTGSCRASFAIGLRLDAVAAHGHLTPHGRAVARAVVEEPAADVAAARLQSRPRAVGHRGVHDADEIGERAVDVLRGRLERRLARVEADDEPAARGGLLEHAGRSRITRAAVVLECQAAERLAHLERAAQVGGADPDASLEARAPRAAARGENSISRPCSWSTVFTNRSMSASRPGAGSASAR